jgi:hypothetical protein
MRSAFEVSPAKRQKQARMHRGQEHEWARRAGPVVVTRTRATSNQRGKPDDEG